MSSVPSRPDVTIDFFALGRRRAGGCSRFRTGTNPRKTQEYQHFRHHFSESPELHAADGRREEVSLTEEANEHPNALGLDQRGTANPDAISLVNYVETRLVNSSATAAFLQDATMHAPFAALVQSAGRPAGRPA
jgi:hypothetical protein